MATQTASPSEQHLSQREFHRWLKAQPPSDLNRYELLHGILVASPPAGWMHSRVGSRLNYLLHQHVAATQQGTVFDASAGYDLPSGDTLEPDGSYVSRERLEAGPAVKPHQFLRVVPNLVVEILSPSTKKRDRIEKKGIYERNGVDEYWIVDAERRTVTVFHLGRSGYGRPRAFRRGVLRSRVLPKLNLGVQTVFLP